MGIFKRRNKVVRRVIMTEAEILKVYNVVPCFACTHWKSDSVKAKVGGFWMACLNHKDGQPMPTPPSPADVMLSCCKREWSEHDPTFVGSFTKADW
jgi:hypothetical protein